MFRLLARSPCFVETARSHCVNQPNVCQPHSGRSTHLAVVSARLISNVLRKLYKHLPILSGRFTRLVSYHHLSSSPRVSLPPGSRLISSMGCWSISFFFSLFLSFFCSLSSNLSPLLFSLPLVSYRHWSSCTVRTPIGIAPKPS